jgi:hypothetical protein
MVAKKWADADEADQQIKEDVGQAPRPNQQNRCPDDQRDDRSCDDRCDDRCNDNRDAVMTIMIDVGRTTLGGGRAATDQLTTPSTPSS